MNKSVNIIVILIASLVLITSCNRVVGNQETKKLPTKVMTKNESLNFLDLIDIDPSLNITTASQLDFVGKKYVIDSGILQKNPNITRQSLTDSSYAIVGDYYIPNSIFESYLGAGTFYISAKVLNSLPQELVAKLLNTRREDVKAWFSLVGITNSEIRSLVIDDHELSVSDMYILQSQSSFRGTNTLKNLLNDK